LVDEAVLRCLVDEAVLQWISLLRLGYDGDVDDGDRGRVWLVCCWLALMPVLLQWRRLEPCGVGNWSCVAMAIEFCGD
jgi:hypothetical protein